MRVELSALQLARSTGQTCGAQKHGGRVACSCQTAACCTLTVIPVTGRRSLRGPALPVIVCPRAGGERVLGAVTEPGRAAAKSAGWRHLGAGPAAGCVDATSAGGGSVSCQKCGRWLRTHLTSQLRLSAPSLPRIPTPYPHHTPTHTHGRIAITHAARSSVNLNKRSGNLGNVFIRIAAGTARLPSSCWYSAAGTPVSRIPHP